MCHHCCLKHGPIYHHSDWSYWFPTVYAEGLLRVVPRCWFSYYVISPSGRSCVNHCCLKHGPIYHHSDWSNWFPNVYADDLLLRVVPRCWFSYYVISPSGRSCVIIAVWNTNQYIIIIILVPYCLCWRPTIKSGTKMLIFLLCYQSIR